jgi:hypothetical protein
MRQFVFLCLFCSLLAPTAIAEQLAESSGDSAAASAEFDELDMSNPGSIADQFLVDRQRKEYLFQIPGGDRLFTPWDELRTELDEEYGFRPNISATHLYQEASDTVGPEDSVSGYEIVVDGTWTFMGRNTPSPTTAGFELLYRDFTSDIPPVALFTQTGSLYPTTVAFGEVDPSVGQLWIQKKFDNRFGFQVGKMFPVSAYDFFEELSHRLYGCDSRGQLRYAAARPRPGRLPDVPASTQRLSATGGP